VNTDLLVRAAQWLEQDPDPETRSELEQIIRQAEAASAEGQTRALSDLAERFSGPLEFGTAGLRGILGAGESRMNRAVVLRTTHGLAHYLLKVDAAAARSRGVVIGYDGRRLSRELAADTAAVLAAAGIAAHVSPIPCPTPIAAYAVRQLGAVAGVMITASHNPPQYNGYKVYWGNGAQIIPPHDTGIAAAIALAPAARDVPQMPADRAQAAGLLQCFPPDLERSYLDGVRALSRRRDGDRSIGIAYTPLHGVGNRLTRQALAEAGFSRVATVEEQAEPDGAFPTVAFPNPEEKGAMDLVFALARRENAALVLANDPDVDRLAVAVPDASGGFVQLTGNQVGTLLGHYLLTEGPEPQAPERRLVLASIVSSPMLGSIARALGVHYEETLTGFKWIANRAMDLERAEGAQFVFGYEEALGYTAGTLVRDKDGISAAVLMAELAAVRRAEGKTLLDELEMLARRYGVFVSGQRAVTLPGSGGLARIAEIMAALREAPPREVGPLRVVSTSDFAAQERTIADGRKEPLALPRTNMIAFDLEGGSRIIARPSGTEPKVKFYFDLREPTREGEPVHAAEDRARSRMHALMEAFCVLAGV
jgi:phosphomannomutase